eukprot:TRINITY_DN10048_c0_g1_i3.p1 TRINITY_DN10048_c0_g1~~TRINITY_DN10048_c0_g1_i3.p1  ORF type:complete len:357 (+),score=80.65 TRINITY_DN10048_c0_g1_i3:287-1357(+)
MRVRMGGAKRASRTAPRVQARLASGAVRVGFIGAGDISNLHAKAVRSMPGAELVGIWNRAGCSVVPDPAARAQQYGCRLFDSAESLVQSSDIDCVFVLTNYETHLRYASMALEAGKPVLVEKPAARGCVEMEQLLQVSADTGVPCMPVHNYVYEPAMEATRSLLENGELGLLKSVHVLYNIFHPESVCARLPGIVRQIGTHHAYLALYLLGADRVREVTAMRSTIREGGPGAAPQENVAAAVLRTESGALVHLEMSFAADDHTSDPWSYYIKVLGTEGGTRFSHNDFVVNRRTPPGVHSHTYLPYPASIMRCDRHFVEEVVGKGCEPLSTLKDAIECQRIMDAVEKSAADGVHVRL